MSDNLTFRNTYLSTARRNARRDLNSRLDRVVACTQYDLAMADQRTQSERDHQAAYLAYCTQNQR